MKPNQEEVRDLRQDLIVGLVGIGGGLLGISNALESSNVWTKWPMLIGSIGMVLGGVWHAWRYIRAKM